MRTLSRTSPRPRGVMLVADDYGLTEGVSAAILDLLAAGRLTGTSAMTARPHWPSHARRLAALGNAADVGLHLTLTLGAPLGPMPGLCPGGEFPPLGRLMRRAFAGALPRAEIEAEIARQIEAFATHFGRLPDYIDGHQHVHVLPGVRGALLAVIGKVWRGPRPWIRDPFDTPGAIIARGVAVGKALTIAAMAAFWRRTLVRHDIEANRGFAGVSPFDPGRDFAADLGRWLLVPGERHLVMCHPGHLDAELPGLDPVVATRPLEYDVLAGPRLADIFAEAGLEPRRFAAFDTMGGEAA